MKIVIHGEAKEIAALVMELQERRGTDKPIVDTDREALIREYEHRLARLKSGASPGNVIFQV